MEDKDPKTNMPVVPGGVYLERGRIDDILEKSLQNFVTIMTAGEGYGKTYAASSFFHKRPGRIVWVQFSERDNVSRRFWENLTNAVGFYSEDARKALVETGFPETTRQFHRFFSVLDRIMVAGRKYVFVGDDFHLLHAKTVLRFIERVLAESLPNLIFLFICRKEPGINAIPLLSKGRLARVGTDELRFSKKETEDFFALRNITLSPLELENIHSDTEGWALAVNFLAGEMEKSGEQYTRRLLNTGAIRARLERTYKGLPSELRTFLVCISFLEYWPMDLLEQLVPRQELVGEMEKLTSFIRFDTYLHGYRIHGIFLDFLRERQGELPAEEIRKVSLLAAEWCLKNNLRMDAALNLERAGDYAGLVDIIYTFPRILPRDAVYFFLGILDRLVKAENRDEENEDYLFLHHVIYSRLLYNLGRFEESEKRFRASVQYFEALPPSPVSSHILMGCYNHLGVISLMTSRYTRDYSGFSNFIKANYYYMRHPRHLKGPITKTNITSYVSQVSWPAPAGEFERAITAFSRVIPHVVSSCDGCFYGIDDLAWAELAYFRGDTGGAERYAQQVVFKAREREQYETENRALFFLLRLRLHYGDYQGVKEIWKQLESQLEIEAYLNRHVIHDIVTGWFYAHTGRSGKTASWLRNEFEESELNSTFFHLETLVKAKCFYAEGQYDAVLDILTFRKNQQGLGSYLLGMLEMGVLEAAARFRLGDGRGAAASLERVYEAALPNGFDMPFVEMGEDMRLLLGEVLGGESTIPRDWLESVRSRASAYGKKLSLVIERFRQEEKTDKEAVFFTRRERLVLQELSRGFTREEIAEGHNLNLSVVKNIISVLYGKLGALNRADAIRIATNMGILEKN
ncbi:MAG: LuxR C-terminal-related transcriptional regulator [Treponema sp.]|jgi:LuxR family maltose regulon positive regulatory protein|nr:LuxR C-terminal-related transcriptional regulator [Treponema sp.]